LFELFGCNVLEARTLAVCATVFHLDKIHNVASFGNDVDFAAACAPILSDNFAAFALKELGRGSFGAAAGFKCRRHAKVL
jgi:hypothetical protein